MATHSDPSDAETGHVTLSYWTDGDGTGKLTIIAAAGVWAGRGEAWFNESALREFGSRLGEYPLASDPPLRLVSGYGAKNSTEFEPTLDIDITQVSSAGQLAVSLHLATFVLPSDLIRSKRELRLVLLTSYQ